MSGLLLGYMYANVQRFLFTLVNEINLCVVNHFYQKKFMTRSQTPSIYGNSDHEFYGKPVHSNSLRKTCAVQENGTYAPAPNPPLDSAAYPARSFQDISAGNPSRYYWIQTNDISCPFRVYCDLDGSDQFACL